MPVYIIRAGDTDAVKIGWAVKPVERLALFQTGHHEKLSILRLIEGPRTAEYWMHRRFKSQHIRGEWFRFDPQMLVVQPTYSEQMDLWLPKRRKPVKQPTPLEKARADFAWYGEMEEPDPARPVVAHKLASWLLEKPVPEAAFAVAWQMRGTPA